MCSSYFCCRCVGTLYFFGGKVTNLSPNKTRIFSKNALNLHNGIEKCADLIVLHLFFNADKANSSFFVLYSSF